MLQINKNMSLLALTSILLFFFMAFTAIDARILPPAVVDTDGNPVQVGVYYHLVPPPRLGAGGGLALGPNRNHSKTCPLSVVQLGLDAMRALPIRFIPVAPLGDGVDVRTSTDYIFEFNTTGTNSSICGKEPKWKVDEFDGSVGTYFISTTNEITTGMAYKFQIRRFGSIESVTTYKLFCCTTYPFVLCIDVGVYRDADGVQRLALTNDSPLELVFSKASSVEQINVL
ncbi:hypothetical protein Sjap_025617 [Stephania japonica]|uniref:Uncharacterized protein n=1 Tax=Stephania japonica TaxID=461633 RepID=A0AAP0E250_9MAGN